MDDEDYLQVQVSEVRHDAGGSVATATGIDVETGDTVTFAGEVRPMYDIYLAIEAGEEPVAHVPHWAVMVRVSA